MSDAKTLQGVVDLVSRLIHDLNRLTARVEALEGTGEPEPEASAFLRRPEVAAVLREAETVEGPPASVPAPGFGVPRLREPIEAVKARLESRFGPRGNDWGAAPADCHDPEPSEWVAHLTRGVSAEGPTEDDAIRALDAKLNNAAPVPRLRQPVTVRPSAADAVCTDPACGYPSVGPVGGLPWCAKHHAPEDGPHRADVLANLANLDRLARPRPDGDSFHATYDPSEAR